MTKLSRSLAQRWRDAVAARTTRKEIAGLADEDRAAVARDLGVTVDDLEAAADAGPRRARLMAGAMEACGLDPAELDRSHPEIVRRAALNCAHCPSSDVCERELATGEARERLDRYCPNAPTFRALET